VVDIFTIAPATRKKKRADGGRAAENDDSDDGAGPSRGRLALDDVNALVRALPVCLLISVVLTVPQSSPEVTKAASALRRIHQPDISGRRYYTPSHWLDQSRVLDLDRPFVLELWAKSIVRSPRGSSQRAQSQPRAGLRPLRLHQLRLRQRLLCLLSFGRHRSAVSLWRHGRSKIPSSSPRPSSDSRPTIGFPECRGAAMSLPNSALRGARSR